MRVFEHFNPNGDACPECGTRDDRPAVLVPIPGTERANIVRRTKQVHEDCLLKFLGERYAAVS